MTTNRNILDNWKPEELNERIRREMRNREVHTPPVSTFRWWARRSHIVFGSILDASEATLGPAGLVVDPFAGGGTTLLEAARRGYQVYGQDINPWAVRGMRALLSLGSICPKSFDDAVKRLTAVMAPLVQEAYGSGSAWITHVFRVATNSCPSCNQILWLYPYALLTLDSRRTGEDKAWFGCRRCGKISVGSRRHGATCSGCGTVMTGDQEYLPGRQAECPHCGQCSKLSTLVQRQPLQYRIVLVERASGQKRRWFELPSALDIHAEREWVAPQLPVGEIPAGKETSVLRRHGITHWHDLYPTRQRTVLMALLKAIQHLEVSDERIRELLTVAAVGTAEMAGLSSRWDRFYLKSYETTANHRFGFAPFTAEPNVWGHEASGRGTFIRRIRQIRKALTWVADKEVSRYIGPAQANVVLGPSQSMELNDGVADLVLTDPPYFGDVQYGELSGIFRSWLNDPEGRFQDEVVVDDSGKDGAAYTTLLGGVLEEARRVLKPDGRLILTYHNRTASAWTALIQALTQAGFSLSTWRWVASENETDHAKRGKMSCSMDIVLECVKGADSELAIPAEPPKEQVEAHFLWAAGKLTAAATRDLTTLPDVEAELRLHPFMRGR